MHGLLVATCAWAVGGSDIAFQCYVIPFTEQALQQQDAQHCSTAEVQLAPPIACRFDGHGGSEAAELAATTMHTHLAAALAAEDRAGMNHWCEYAVLEKFDPNNYIPRVVCLSAITPLY